VSRADDHGGGVLPARCRAVLFGAEPDQRHLTDLPGGTRPVRIQLHVRKLVCRHPSCPPPLHGASARARRRLCAQPQRLITALQATPVADRFHQDTARYDHHVAEDEGTGQPMSKTT